jgi:ribose/xylose/arabinose/galactoside ABC-type transport system permease subunit
MKLRLNQKNIPILATIAVFLLIYALGSGMYRGFFSLRVFVNLFIDNAFVGVIAVGMTFVIISGGIDLSVGSVIAFVGVLTAILVHDFHMHPIPVMLVGLAFGAVLGFLMGCLIHFYNLPPFLVTLVGMFLARGLAFLVSLNAIPIKHPFFNELVDFGIPLGFRAWLPVTGLIFIAVVLVGIYLSHFTKFGRNVYAIGGNEQSAILMGLPVGRTKILIYTLNGTLAALAGIVYSMYTLSGYPLACVGLELDVIAAVVIGGTLLTGGAGYVQGTLIGILILGLIQTFITFQGTLSSWWTKIVIGVLLFIFILLQRYLASTSISSRVSATQPNTTP